MMIHTCNCTGLISLGRKRFRITHNIFLDSQENKTAKSRSFVQTIEKWLDLVKLELEQMKIMTQKFHFYLSLSLSVYTLTYENIS